MRAFLARYWLFALCLVVLVAGYLGLLNSPTPWIQSALSRPRIFGCTLLLLPILLAALCCLFERPPGISVLGRLFIVDLCLLYAVPIACMFLAEPPKNEGERGMPWEPFAAALWLTAWCFVNGILGCILFAASLIRGGKSP